MKGRHAKPDPFTKHINDLKVNQFTEDQAARVAQELAAKSPVKTREEEITDRVDKIVDSVVNRYLRMRQIDTKPTTLAEAVDTLYKMLREELRSWPHDDLLLQVSFMLAIVSAEKLRERLI